VQAAVCRRMLPGRQILRFVVPAVPAVLMVRRSGSCGAGSEQSEAGNGVTSGPPGGHSGGHLRRLLGRAPQAGHG